MAIFRGTTGTGSSDNTIVSAVTEQAGIATTKAGEASTSATTATTKASEASTSATTATTKAGEASNSADTASDKATEANTAKGLAEDAQTAAESARDTAQTHANTANNSSVQTVAGISTEVQNVNNIRTEIQNVDTIKTDVSSVSGLSDELDTIVNKYDGTTNASGDNKNIVQIDTVADNIANVNNVGNNIANVNAVHGNASNINTVAADGTDIGTVATNIANVNTVAGISSNVTTVAGLESKMDTVIADASDIGAVAGNIGDVTTVAGINSDVDTVAGIAAKVTTVADNISDVQNADTNATNAASSASNASASATSASNSATTATTKATEASNSATAASNSATTATTKASQAAGSATTAGTSASTATTKASEASASATTATTKAGEAASSASAASGSASTAVTKASEASASATSAASSATKSSNAASTWNNFYNSYLGVADAPPSVDVLGNAIVAGALYYDTGAGSNAVGLYVYNGSTWVYSTNYNNVTAPYSLSQDLATNSHDISFGDNAKATFGASDDLQIYHDGSNSYIRDDGTGELRINSDNAVRIRKHDNETMALFNNNGSVDLYYDNAVKLATTSTGIDVTGDISLGDNGKAKFGASDDLQIYHDGTHSYIDEVGTGSLYIRANDFRLSNADGTQNHIIANNSGEVSLRYSGNPKLATTSTGIDVTGDVSLGDNSKVKFGASDDLQIYHDGSNSYISEQGTGDLILRSYQNMYLKAAFSGASDETFLSATGNGEVSLYHNNSPKLATTSSGIDVTGGMTTTGNVGIGTSSPSQELHIASSGEADIRLQGSGSGNHLDIFHNASDFGLWGTGTQQLKLATNNSERMRIDSSGNVGIGTSSPHGKLRLNDDSGACQLYMTSENSSDCSIIFGRQNDLATGSISYFHSDDSLRLNGYNNNESMRIDSSRNVLVGTTTSTVGFNNAIEGVNLRAEGRIFASADQDYPLNLSRNTNDGDIAVFRKDGTTVGSIGSAFGNRMFVGSGDTAVRFAGDLDTIVPWNGSTNALRDASIDLGEATGRFKDLYLSGTANVEKVSATRTNGVCGEFNRSNNGHAVQFFHNSVLVGSVSVTGSATSYNTSSDQRLKENIQDADDAGSKIDAIQVRQFDWKSDGSHQDYGVIAQELVEVAPEAVTAGETEDDMMSVDYSKLVPTLIKEIQTLRNRVAQLENN